MGRLIAIKDQEIFLRAEARFLAARPDMTFLVAGDGNRRQQLAERAAPALGEHIGFLGWVSDLPHLYSALDAAVLTSKIEGAPTALIAAGTAGKPVVATLGGGVPNVARDGETGFLVPPRRPEAVARRILDRLDDPAAARAMGAAAHEWVAGRFPAQRLADDPAELYRELLSRRGIAPV